jgi:hypothetical protein
MGCLRTFMAMRRFHAPKVLASVALTVVALAGCGSDSPETVADAATTTVTVDPDRATDQISLDEELDLHHNHARRRHVRTAAQCGLVGRRVLH